MWKIFIIFYRDTTMSSFYCTLLFATFSECNSVNNCNKVLFASSTVGMRLKSVREVDEFSQKIAYPKLKRRKEISYQLTTQGWVSFVPKLGSCLP